MRGPEGGVSARYWQGAWSDPVCLRGSERPDGGGDRDADTGCPRDPRPGACHHGQPDRLRHPAGQAVRDAIGPGYAAENFGPGTDPPARSSRRSGVTEYAAGDRGWGSNHNGRCRRRRRSGDRRGRSDRQDRTGSTMPKPLSVEAGHRPRRPEAAGTPPGERAVSTVPPAPSVSRGPAMAAEEATSRPLPRPARRPVRGLGARTVVDHTTEDLATYPDRFDLVRRGRQDHLRREQAATGNSGRYVRASSTRTARTLPRSHHVASPRPHVHFPLPTGRRRRSAT